MMQCAVEICERPLISFLVRSARYCSVWLPGIFLGWRQASSLPQSVSAPPMKRDPRRSAESSRCPRNPSFLHWLQLVQPPSTLSSTRASTTPPTRNVPYPLGGARGLGTGLVIGMSPSHSVHVAAWANSRVLHDWVGGKNKNKTTVHGVKW